MFVNSIGPVNAINMVSKAALMLRGGGRVQLYGAATRVPHPIFGRSSGPAHNERLLQWPLHHFHLEFRFIPKAEVLKSKQHLQPVANGPPSRRRRPDGTPRIIKVGAPSRRVKVAPHPPASPSRAPSARFCLPFL